MGELPSWLLSEGSSSPRRRRGQDCGSWQWPVVSPSCLAASAWTAAGLVDQLYCSEPWSGLWGTTMTCNVAAAWPQLSVTHRAIWEPPNPLPARPLPAGIILVSFVVHGSFVTTLDVNVFVLLFCCHTKEKELIVWGSIPWQVFDFWKLLLSSCACDNQQWVRYLTLSAFLMADK